MWYSISCCHKVLESISSSSLNARAQGFSFSNFSICLYHIFSQVARFLGSLKSIKFFSLPTKKIRENGRVNKNLLVRKLKFYFVIYHLYARNLNVLMWRASLRCETCRTWSDATWPHSLQITVDISKNIQEYFIDDIVFIVFIVFLKCFSNWLI